MTKKNTAVATTDATPDSTEILDNKAKLQAHELDSLIYTELKNLPSDYTSLGIFKNYYGILTTRNTKGTIQKKANLNETQFNSRIQNAITTLCVKLPRWRHNVSLTEKLPNLTIDEISTCLPLTASSFKKEDSFLEFTRIFLNSRAGEVSRKIEEAKTSTPKETIEHYGLFEDVSEAGEAIANQINTEAHLLRKEVNKVQAYVKKTRKKSTLDHTLFSAITSTLEKSNRLIVAACPVYGILTDSKLQKDVAKEFGVNESFFAKTISKFTKDINKALKKDSAKLKAATKKRNYSEILDLFPETSQLFWTTKHFLAFCENINCITLPKSQHHEARLTKYAQTHEILRLLTNSLNARTLGSADNPSYILARKVALEFKEISYMDIYLIAQTYGLGCARVTATTLAYETGVTKSAISLRITAIREDLSSKSQDIKKQISATLKNKETYGKELTGFFNLFHNDSGAAKFINDFFNVKVDATRFRKANPEQDESRPGKIETIQPDKILPSKQISEKVALKLNNRASALMEKLDLLEQSESRIRGVGFLDAMLFSNIRNILSSDARYLSCVAPFFGILQEKQSKSDICQEFSTPLYYINTAQDEFFAALEQKLKPYGPRFIKETNKQTVKNLAESLNKTNSMFSTPKEFYNFLSKLEHFRGTKKDIQKTLPSVFYTGLTNIDHLDKVLSSRAFKNAPKKTQDLIKAITEALKNHSPVDAGMFCLYHGLISSPVEIEYISESTKRSNATILQRCKSIREEFAQNNQKLLADISKEIHDKKSSWKKDFKLFNKMIYDAKHIDSLYKFLLKSQSTRSTVTRKTRSSVSKNIAEKESKEIIEHISKLTVSKAKSLLKKLNKNDKTESNEFAKNLVSSFIELDETHAAIIALSFGFFENKHTKKQVADALKLSPTAFNMLHQISIDSFTENYNKKDGKLPPGLTLITTKQFDQYLTECTDIFTTISQLSTFIYKVIGPKISNSAIISRKNADRGVAITPSPVSIEPPRKANSIDEIDVICANALKDTSDFLSTELEVEVFNKRLGPETSRVTLDDIGLAHNLTRERIRQIESALRSKIITEVNLDPETNAQLFGQNEDKKLTSLLPKTAKIITDEKGLERFTQKILGVVAGKKPAPKKSDMNPVVKDKILDFIAVTASPIDIKALTNHVKKSTRKPQEFVERQLDLFCKAGLGKVKDNELLVSRAVGQEVIVAHALAGETKGFDADQALELVKKAIYDFPKKQAKLAYLNSHGDAKYIYLSAKGTYKHINTLNVSQEDEDTVISTLARILKTQGKGAYNLHYELYMKIKSALPKSMTDYYVFRQIVKSNLKPLKCSFNGRALVDTLCYQVPLTSRPVKDIIYEAIVMYGPLKPFEIAQRISANNNFVSTLVRQLVDEKKIEETERGGYIAK